MKKEKLSAKQIQDLLAMFNPNYYSAKHVEAILHWPPQQTMELLEKTELSVFEEETLVKKAPAKVVEAYIKKHHGLSIVAQIALIRRGDKELIDCFRRSEFCGFSSAAEPELIRSFKCDAEFWWKEYFHCHKLEGSAEIALIDRHDIKLLMLYLDKESWSNDACMRLLTTYTPEEIGELISKHPRFYLTKEAEAFLVKEMHEDVVYSYISRHQLDIPAQVALVKRGSHGLIMYYLKYYRFNSVEAITELAKRAVYDEVAQALSQSPLPGEAQIAIIDKPNDKLFSLLIKKMKLTCSAEIALVKDGYKPKRHKRIMQYLRLRQIEDADALEVILKRGNSEEIKACIRRKCFSQSIIPTLLIKRGRKDEIELYLSVYHPGWKIPE